jgi:hypothetical protein
VFSAVAWIRKRNAPEASIEPLIAELERRERKAQDRVYFDILRALRHLSGADLTVAADWKNFWEARKQGHAAPKKRTSPGVTAVARPASFFSVTVDSDRVLFIIDISGSMSERDPAPEGSVKPQPEVVDPEQKGRTTVVVKKKAAAPKAPPAGPPPPDRERLFRAKEELIKTLQSLPASVRFGIMSFSHEIHFFEGGRTLINATEANKARAIAWVRVLQASGATRTDLALHEGLQYPELDTIYLLTDGAPRDEKDTPIPPEQVLEAVREENRFHKCRIHTFGFKQAGNKMIRFVIDLAGQNDGKAVLLP